MLCTHDIGATLITAIASVTAQPDGALYVIIETPPDTPLTTPVVLTEAIAVEPLSHTPPGVASARASVAPRHTFELLPVIAAGSALTVISSVAVHPAPNE